MNTFKLEKDHLLDCIRIAGDAAYHIQQNGFTTMKKENNDLLTEADITANAIIKSSLLNAFPEDGWLSEETVDDPKRLQMSRVWIVDPIDGTIEFTKQLPEFAVSVALVIDQQPVLAAIYHPCTQTLFHAIKHQGAYLNGKRIYCKSNKNKLTLLASRSEVENGKWKINLPDIEVKPIGSIAYKLALIAAGEADATLSLGPKSEWDIAAGCLLIQEAGGFTSDKYKRPFKFNQANTRVDSIVATSRIAHELVFEYIDAAMRVSC